MAGPYQAGIRLLALCPRRLQFALKPAPVIAGDLARAGKARDRRTGPGETILPGLHGLEHVPAPTIVGCDGQRRRVDRQHRCCLGGCPL